VTLRYSEVFRLQVIAEIGSGKFDCVEHARGAYGIGGVRTLHRWLHE
jgi:hypothetical protein